MADHYRVVRRTDQYSLIDCGNHYEVQRASGERIVLEDIGRPGEPGQPGPPGPPGPAPTDEVVQAALDAWDAAHPSSYHWESSTPVAIIDFDFPLSFTPGGVRITDTSGTEYQVPYTIAGQHFHADLGGAVMSVHVDLS